MKTGRYIYLQSRVPLTCVILSFAGPAPALAQGGPCTPFVKTDIPFLEWYEVRDLIGFDDGSGWALYVAGYNGSTTAFGMPRWNGQAWDWVATGGGFIIEAFAVFDDGSGPALYGGGQFVVSPGAPLANLARWDGQQWQPLAGAVNGYVRALATFDDGTGEALYVGGDFSMAGSVPASRIARWDGQNWSALGAGVDNLVLAIAGMHEASGPALYVAGRMDTAGGMPARRIARWDGQQWSALGDGLGTAANHSVRALADFHDGSNRAIYAAGWFRGDVSYLARWNGAAWSSVGPAMDDNPTSLATADGGDGTFLYAVGWFTSIGGVPFPRAARWNGAEWSNIGDLAAEHLGLAVVGANDGAPAVYMAFYQNQWHWHSKIIRFGCEVPSPVCYANCDTSTAEPILTIDDFICFVNEFAAASALPLEQQITHYANCDGSTEAPILTINDFICFINAFATGCP